MSRRQALRVISRRGRTVILTTPVSERRPCGRTTPFSTGCRHPRPCELGFPPMFDVRRPPSKRPDLAAVDFNERRPIGIRV